MSEAAAWAAAGAPHGALVTATHQTAGRGRHGRAWLDAPGQSLMLSLVLRPDLPSDRLGLVGLAAGWALVQSLQAVGVEAGLKWPNDVVVGTRKLAGVLAETRWDGAAPAVILGLGLNVRQRSFPPAVADRATSVALETGLDPAPDTLLAPLLEALADALDRAGRPAFVRDVEAALVGRGAAVTVAFPGTDRAALVGTATGLAADGALRVATASGVETVHAGEVTLGATPAEAS